MSKGKKSKTGKKSKSQLTTGELMAKLADFEWDFDAMGRPDLEVSLPKSIKSKVLRVARPGETVEQTTLRILQLWSDAVEDVLPADPLPATESKPERKAITGKSKKHWTDKAFKHLDAWGKEVNTICLFDLSKPILDELHKATPSGDFLSETAIKVLREWADGARTKRQSEAIAELVRMCAESPVVAADEKGVAAKMRRRRDGN